MGRRVRAGDAPPAELAAVADAIAEQEMRAAEVLRRIRGFLRQTEVPRTAVDLSGVVDEAVRLAAGEARETGVHLVCDRTGAPLLVQADPVQLVQVLLNLLRNAFAAVGANAPGARDVGVRVQRLADGRAEVAVHDAGPGVPAEIAQRLFEPFTTTRRDGLGLGLAISRAIVEAHGGRMWSAPNSPRGAVFAFSLPLVGGAVDAA
jgi:C4-dicarboxylate-specific signal transduction histidine kinase